MKTKTAGHVFAVGFVIIVMALIGASIARGTIIAVEPATATVVPVSYGQAKRLCTEKSILNWTFELGDPDGDGIYTKEDALTFAELGYTEKQDWSWNWRTECYCMNFSGPDPICYVLKTSSLIPVYQVLLLN